MTAKVEILLRGMAITSNEGNFAPCGVYLVTVESNGVTKRIVFDTAHAGRRLKLQANLRKLKLKAADVDMVVISHGHWDHTQNIDVFPDSTVVVHSLEFEYLTRPHRNDHATPIWTRGMFAIAEQSNRLMMVEEGDELAPGVTVMHLPGHSPGSIGLRVETENGIALITGDALAAGPDAEACQCPNVFWDPVAANASVARVISEPGAIIYPGHDRPFIMSAERIAEYQTQPTVLVFRLAQVQRDNFETVLMDRSGQHLMARAREVAETAKVAESAS